MAIRMTSSGPQSVAGEFDKKKKKKKEEPEPKKAPAPSTEELNKTETRKNYGEGGALPLSSQRVEEARAGAVPVPTTHQLNQYKGVTMLNGVDTSGMSSIEIAKLAAGRPLAEREQRAAGFEEATGAGELYDELQQKIENKPDLTPTPLLERGAELGMELPEWGARAVAAGANLIPGVDIKIDPNTSNELAKTKAGKALGLAIGGTGVALAAIGLAPYVAVAASSSIIRGVMGSKLLSLKGATGAIALAATGGAVLDWDGLEMNTQRKIIGGYVEDGEKLVAIDKSGGNPEVILGLLSQAAEEIDEAERVLKTAGNNNIQNKIAKEYLDDMNNIRTARLAVWRRIGEIQTIAETGSAVLSPEELMYQTAQFKK